MKNKKILGILCLVIVMAIVIGVLLFHIFSLNRNLEVTKDELNNAQNELTVVEEQNTKIQQMVSDYQALYGEINRSDKNVNINPDNADKSVLLMSVNNPCIVVKKNGFTINLNKCIYSDSNKKIEIDMDITNQSNQPIKVELIDAYVGDCTLPNMFDGSEFFIDTENTVTSSTYFSTTPLEANNLTKFDKFGCKLVVSADDGTNLYSRDIVIMWNAFTQ